MANARLTGKAAAHQLDWDESKISRMLSGKRPGSEVDTAALLALCRVHGEERNRLLSLARDQSTQGLLRQHGSHLPKEVAELVEHENLAVELINYEGVGVPGLLQTDEYATAVITALPNVPRSEIQERVAIRLARQALLSAPGSRNFTFYLHEFVLRLPVGGPAVMSAQLHKLLQLSVRLNITIRVLPAELGAHAAFCGSFMFLEFADFHPVIYLESDTSSLFLEKQEESTAYRQIIASLAGNALDVGQSRELISQVAVELYADGDDHYDLT
ncbi:helix-turn-helix protein [Labedaea rhizosphaerae]|uniref:Helix-turn-helix protein n=2 Tax=Labedaea rhizosphaerae TaxID=598644 RepID=A0A4R6SN55_LABRH|nr:helix-turn-helix protein [Labedaea rhizosphaerae]